MAGSLNFDLCGLVRDYFRDTFVIAYLSSHADALVPIHLLGIAKLRSVTSPNQHRENLVWYGLSRL